MDNTNPVFLKTDNNKIINEKCIRWVKKMDECLEVCIKTDGCREGVNTHKICKINNFHSYEKLNRLFS